MGQIQQAIATLKPQRAHVYSQGWWGNSSHINIGYRSDDPAIVRRQVESCKAVVSPAALNICQAWYGPTLLPNDAYTQLLMQESENQGTQFAVMIDKGARSDASAMLAYLQDNYFGSPAYAQLNGKLMVWSFNAKADVVKLFSSQPEILLITENSGPYSYDWPQGFAPDTPQKHVQWYLSQKGQVMIPCLWKGFDDHKVSNPKESAWGGPARKMDSGPTGWDLWNSLVALIQKSGKQFSELGITGLDDYEERTRLEPFILQEYAGILNAQAAALLAAN